MVGCLPMPKLESQNINGLSVLTDEGLYGESGVRVAFTSRAGGVSRGAYESLNTASHVGDEPCAVAENRRIALTALGADAGSAIMPNQVHGVEVVEVKDPTDLERARKQAAIGADAVLVSCEDVAVLMNSADCLPVVVVAPSGRFVVAHAGWRGALDHIARLAVQALVASEGCDAAALNAYIGPHIGSCCFEVGPDVSQRFQAEFGLGALSDAGNVDLSAVVESDLVAVGMSSLRIADAHVCTKCNARHYFSYRASGGLCGRNATIAFRAKTCEAAQKGVILSS